MEPLIVYRALLEAQAAGLAAATKVVNDNVARYSDGGFDLSAGAVLHLQLSPRSTLGTALRELAGTHPQLFCILPGRRSEVIIGIHGMSWRQEQCVNIAAEEAALAVLTAHLDVDAYVTSIES